MAAKKVTLTYLAMVLLAGACCALASIERQAEPVKVDYQNSGPRYDIDDLERTRVMNENSNPESNQVMTAPAPKDPDNDSSRLEAPLISIRRILLVPMMTSSSSGDDNNEQRPGSSDPMRMFGVPPRSLFAPFSSRHLFGADEASRPAPFQPDESRERPIVSSSGNNKQEADERARPDSALLDPLALLMEAMRQALNPANMMVPEAPSSTDLNKEASGSSDKPSGSNETGPEKPLQSSNATWESVVEIDGKKFLRKTILNRHVGEGITFVTRRLIFSPLNETEAEAAANNNKLPTTTIEPSTEATSKVEKVDEAPVGSSSSTTGPAANEAVVTKEPASTDLWSSTTVATDKEDTTTKGEGISGTVAQVETFMEKVRELAAKLDSTSTSTTSTSTTVKPSSSS